MKTSSNDSRSYLREWQREDFGNSLPNSLTNNSRNSYTYILYFLFERVREYIREVFIFKIKRFLGAKSGLLHDKELKL